MSAEKLEQEGRRRRRLFGQRSEPEEIEDSAELDEDENRALTPSKGRATPSRRRQEEEEDQRSFPVKTRDTVVDYFDGVRSELDKVVWPTREEAQRLTAIVLLTLIVASLILGAISVIFTELFTIGLGRPVILLAVVLIALVVGVVGWRMYNRRASTSPY